MMTSNEKREKLLSEDIFGELKQYLNFRHFFRHSYDFVMEWDKMKELVVNVKEVWIEVRESIEKLIKSLE